MWHWEFKWRRGLHRWEIASVDEILSLIRSCNPNKNSIDKLVWKHDSGKMYSVKSFIEEVSKERYERILPASIVEFIWQRRGPLRAQLTMWFLATNSLKTWSVLLNLQLISTQQAVCPFCNNSMNLLLTFSLVAIMFGRSGQQYSSGGEYKVWYIAMPSM